MNDEIKRIYDTLSQKYSMPDINSFRQKLLTDPNERVRVHKELSNYYEMPDFEIFESKVVGSTEVAGEVEKESNVRETPFLETVASFLRIGTRQGTPLDYWQAANTLSNFPIGFEFMVTNPHTTVENMLLEDAKLDATRKTPRGREMGMTSLFTGGLNPFYVEDDKEREKTVAKYDERLHKNYAQMANDLHEIQQKYVDAGIYDREETNFIKEQMFSLGMNLPIVALSGGLSRAGLGVLSTAVRTVGYPLFTIAEASSYAGENYADTAKKDSSGKVIAGTGDLDIARTSMGFGLISGMFEFFGPHSAFKMFRVGNQKLSKEITARQFLINLNKVGMVEGIEEGVYQGPIQQAGRILMDLQEGFDVSQSVDEFIHGYVGGILLGSTSIPSTMSDLKKLKTYVEKDALPFIDRLEKNETITKEKADGYREIANAIIETPVDELQPAIEKLNEVITTEKQEAAKRLQDFVGSLNQIAKRHKTITEDLQRQDIEDPMARYEVALGDHSESFISYLEGTKEFQDLQAEVFKEMVDSGVQNANNEDVKRETHRRLQSTPAEATERFATAKNLLNKLTFKAAQAIQMDIEANEASDTVMPGSSEDTMYQRDPELARLKKEVNYRGKFKYSGGFPLWNLRRKVKAYNLQHNTNFDVISKMTGQGGMVETTIINREMETGEQQNMHFQKGVQNQPVFIEDKTKESLSIEDYTKITEKLLDLLEIGDIQFDPAEFIDKANLTPEEGKVKLDFQEVVDRSPRAKEVLEKIQVNDKIHLSGSLALALKGAIYRKGNDPIHDLDFRTSMTSEEIVEFMKEIFPDAIKTKDIVFNKGTDQSRSFLQFLVPFDMQIRRNETGEIVEIQKQKQKGDYITIDFFLTDKLDGYEHTFKGSEGQDVSVNVSRPYVTLAAKVDIKPQRQKDIDDIVRYFYEGRDLGRKDILFQKTPSGGNVTSPTGYTNQSGGAVGSDTIWETEGAKYGVKTNAFSFDEHNTKSKNKVVLTIEQLKEGGKAVLKANETLKRNISNLSSYVKKLLARNWFQVKNADAVFAIGNFNAETETVDGGTGWAVQMAIDNNKPVFIFDQQDKSWYSRLPGEGWQNYEGIPTLTPKFAGIGTRKISEAGTQAIKDVYEKTFSGVQSTIPSQTGINISSYESGLGKQLSNFAAMPISFRGKLYSSSEAAYQQNKRGLDDPGVLELMTEILTAKLAQYSNLTEEISKRGGIEFLNQSTHNLVKQGKIVKEDRWTGKDGLFMQALRQAYSNVTSQSSIQPVPFTQTAEGVSEPGLRQEMTAKEFFKKITDKGYVDESIEPFTKWLETQISEGQIVKLVDETYVIARDKNGIIQRMGNDKGAYTFYETKNGGPIIINIAKIGQDKVRVYNTFAHEMGHATFHTYLRKGHKNFNKTFYNQISGLMDEVSYRFKNDHRDFYNANKADLDVAMENPEEFLMHSVSKTSVLGDWMRSNTLSNNTRQTYLGKVLDILKAFFLKKFGKADPTFMDAMETYLNQHFGSPSKVSYNNMIYDDTSDIYTSMEEIIGSIEAIQDPNTSIDNPRVVRSVGRLIADHFGETPTDYISYVQSLSFEQFRNRVISIPGWSKAVSLYYDTHNFDFTVGELMEKMAIQLYEFASSLENRPTVRLVVEYDAMQETEEVRVEELGDYYKDRTGAYRSGWRNKIRLADRIPMLNELFGTQFELVYLDDVQFNERTDKGVDTNWKSINSIDRQDPDRNRRYAKLFNRAGYIFLGTWSDKGTVVALKPSGEINNQMVSQIESMYSDAAEKLGVKFREHSKDYQEVAVNQILRLVIEDFKLGGKVADGQLQSALFNPEDKNTWDLVKIFKRPVDVAPMVATIQTPDRVKKIMDKNLVGIEEGDYGLEARTVIVNAMPEPGQWIQTINFHGREFTVDMHDVFVNSLGTETTDGVIYYLDEGFGQAYRELHGIIKPGVIKAYIMDTVSNIPFFGKAAIHRMATSEMLGAWMKQNNVTLMISSTSAKINGGYKVSELNKPDEVEIFNIPFADIHRNSEKGIVKKSVRGLVQSLSANLNTKDNPFYKGDHTPYINGLFESLFDEFIDSVNDMEPASLLQELKELALEGTSQYERDLAGIILDVAYTVRDKRVADAESIPFIDKERLKQYKVQRNISNERLAEDLGGIFHEPYFAELLKSRIRKSIHKFINYRGTSTWSTLRPDVGWAEASNIEDVFRYILEDEKGKRGKSEIDDEIRETVFKRMEKYIDLKSGRLKENAGFLSDDITSQFNIAPLDMAIVTVVPSDGMTAQQAPTIFPISKNRVDPGTAVMNSEQTQTRGGKDFDADALHINPYNKEQGTRKDYKKYGESIRETQEEHKKRTLDIYRAVLKDNTLQEADIYSKEVQLKFMQILSESPQGSDKTYWHPVTSSFELLDLFAKDIGTVINERKFITAKSQLGFSSKIGTRNFTTNHNKLQTYYLIAMRLTNDMVDRPTNENSLYYTFSPERLAKFMYNLDLESDNFNDAMTLKASALADKFLFGYGTKFTSGYNLEEHGQDRGLGEDLKYIEMQQDIFELLTGDRASKRRLAGMFENWVKQTQGHISAKIVNNLIEKGKQYILEANITNPKGSPLLNAVNDIPLFRIPNVGTSRPLYALWQTKIQRLLNQGREGLIQSVEEKHSNVINEFRSPANREYIRNFLLTESNEPLHLLKAKLITLILPVDQNLRTEQKGTFYTSVFNKANEYAYPRLMKLLLERRTLEFKPAVPTPFNKDAGVRAVFNLGTYKIILQRTPDNQMSIVVQREDGKKAGWRNGNDLLHSNTKLAEQVRNQLFSEDGIFSSYENRWKLSQLISFGRNIGLQGRVEYAKELLDNELGIFSPDEKMLFWDSLVGYPDPDDMLGVKKTPTNATPKTLDDPAGVIRFPMNLVAFTREGYPDQKNLLRIAQSTNDRSGRSFLKRYFMAGKETYPGLGLHHSVEIENQITDGGLTTEMPTILYQRDLRDNVNDETKTQLDGFLDVYDLTQKEAKDIDDDVLGIAPRLYSGRFGPLTKLQVTQEVFSDSLTKVPGPVNLEAIAVTKAKSLISSIKSYNYYLDIIAKRIDKAVADIRKDTALNESAIYERMNLASEQPLPYNLEFFYNEQTGKVIYLASNGLTYEYSTLNEMYDHYNTPEADRKLHTGIITLREMYDYWNIRMATNALNYLRQLRESMPEGFVNQVIIDKLISKWDNEILRMNQMRGRYFPRVYEAGVYEQLVEPWALWNAINELNPEATAERLTELFNDLSQRENLPEDIQRIVDRERTTLTVDRHEGRVYSWQRRRVLPDWLAEGRYITNNMKMHTAHRNQFQNAILNDITKVEWLFYEHNASMAEKSPATITKMRKWYGNMTTDKYMKAQKVKVEELKEMDQVAFYYHRGRRTSYIQGEVQSIEGNIIQMNMNPEAVEADLRRQLRHYEQTHDEILTNPFIRPDKRASRRQIETLDNLLDQGYIEEYNPNITLLNANDLIIEGLRETLNDRGNWGRFDLDRVFVKQYSGRRGIEVPRKVERSMLRGKSDDLMQAIQFLSATVFLGNPAAAVRNYMEAKYRVVQDFGWLRYSGATGIYYNVLDAMPEETRRKFPGSERLHKRLTEMKSSVRGKAKQKIAAILEAAEKGDLGVLQEALYRVQPDRELGTDEQDALIGAAAAKYIFENGLAGTTEIGAAYVKEVGSSDAKERWGKLKSKPLELTFMTAESAVRRASAFLFAYKAVVYDGLTDIEDIMTVIEKGVAKANSLYDMIDRKLMEGTPAGKVLQQYSQFNSYQRAIFNMGIDQAKRLGQLKDAKTLEDIMFNVQAFFKAKQVYIDENGVEQVRKIQDAADPYIPGRIAKFVFQDSLTMVYSLAFPGLRLGNPVNKKVIYPLSFLINALLHGEMPDEWDLGEFIFLLFGFRMGLGLTYPMQVAYNIISEKEKFFSFPKGTMLIYDLAKDFGTLAGWIEPENRPGGNLKTEWYELGKLSKYLTSVDLTPHTRRYYSDEQRRLTEMAPHKRAIAPLVTSIDAFGIPIPIPSDDLIPFWNLAKYSRR